MEAGGVEPLPLFVKSGPCRADGKYLAKGVEVSVAYRNLDSHGTVEYSSVAVLIFTSMGKKRQSQFGPCLVIHLVIGCRSVLPEPPPEPCKTY